MVLFDSHFRVTTLHRGKAGQELKQKMRQAPWTHAFYELAPSDLLSYLPYTARDHLLKDPHPQWDELSYIN